MLRRDEKGRRLESGCLQGPPGIRELQEWEVQWGRVRFSCRLIRRGRPCCRSQGMAKIIIRAKGQKLDRVGERRM